VTPAQVDRREFQLAAMGPADSPTVDSRLEVTDPAKEWLATKRGSIRSTGAPSAAAAWCQSRDRRQAWRRHCWAAKSEDGDHVVVDTAGRTGLSVMAAVPTVTPGLNSSPLAFVRKFGGRRCGTRAPDPPYKVRAVTPRLNRAL